MLINGMPAQQDSPGQTNTFEVTLETNTTPRRREPGCVSLSSPLQPCCQHRVKESNSEAYRVADESEAEILEDQESEDP